MQSRPFPRTLIFFVVAIAIVNAIAEKFYWYWLIRWFDMPMHFAGGVWLASAAIWWRFFSGEFPAARMSISALVVWSLLSALGVGLLWEVYEAAVSYWTVGHGNDVIDTLSDLCFDTLGGLVVAGATWWYTKNK